MVRAMRELCKSLEQLLTDVHSQKETDAGALDTAKAKAESLFNAAVTVERSWSGSGFGYHWDLYFGDFEMPPPGDAFSVEWGGIHGLPDGWRQRAPEEVKDRIERLSGTTFSGVAAQFETLLGSAKRLHSNIIIGLAPLRRVGGFKKEQELLEALEATDWADKADNQFVADRLNALPRMTRDSEAFTQGCRIPSHTHYAGSAVKVIRGCEAIQGFWDLSERLLKQLGLQKDALRRAESSAGGAPSDIGERYRRLVEFNLGAGALLLTALLAALAEFTLRRYPWPWLLHNADNLAIRVRSYLTAFFFLLGLLMPRLRRWCWGGAATSALIAVISLFR